MQLGGAAPNSTGFGAVEEGLTRVEAGTSWFLSISESDLSVHAELGQESQASGGTLVETSPDTRQH